MPAPTLGQFEFAILVTVGHLGDAAYGARVRRDVSLRLRREQSVGAVYTTLQRLEDKGLVKSRMSDPEPVRGGRAKRYFRLTTAGSLALKHMREATDRLLAIKPPRWRPI